MILLYYWSKLALILHGKSIRGSKLDRTSRVNYGSNIVNSSIGRYSYCGYNCWIIEADIGAFCSISNDVKIGGPSHPMDWVSTSPLFHKGKNIFGMHFSELEFNPYKRTMIGNDVWIGENALVKAGVTIGNGAIIGMGSVLTKSVGDYEIWAGNPATLIRKRFSDDLIRKISDSLWWNEDKDKLAVLSESFSNPTQAFMKD